MDWNSFIKHFWSSDRENSAREPEEKPSNYNCGQVQKHGECDSNRAKEIENDQSLSSATLNKSSTNERASYDSENCCRTNKSIVKSCRFFVPTEFGLDDRGSLVIS